MSVIGYCIGPLIIGSLSIVLGLWGPLALAVNVGCVWWAVKCSLRLLANDLPKEKKMLSAVPLLLFFILLDWIILVM